MKIVFTGDSWCSYLPYITKQVGLATHLYRMLGKRIIDIGNIGDTAQDALSLSRRKKLEKEMVNCDILCVSIGGNSIAGDHATLWLNDNVGQGWENATDEEMMRNNINIVLGCYNDICLIRDEIAPNCKIISHTYDIPSIKVIGKGIFGFGPWLEPSLTFCGWDNLYDQHKIISKWVTFLADNLLEHSKKYKNWKVINTIGALSPNDWSNELHPNQVGYRKIARLFAEEIKGII